jgi:hypothetical protein
VNEFEAFFSHQLTFIFLPSNKPNFNQSPKFFGICSNQRDRLLIPLQTLIRGQELYAHHVG